jgi:formylglycine-generating enzyme required for sulfatase activity
LQRYWCAIEAGPFWFGDDNRGDLRQMTMPYRYSIGRYLVTNAEYARFKQAGGYEEKDWWTEQGWEYIQPNGGWRGNHEPARLIQPYHWNDEQYNQPNQPVYGVRWYEAMAYCKWLTAQGHRAGWLPHDKVIRLPTSLEWERAARHTDRRRYPWGDEAPTVEHANYADTGIGTPSPIGCFPRGMAECGALDMAGNVMEWLATPYQQDEQMEPQADFAPGDWILRTYADWRDNLEHLRCGSRGRSLAYHVNGVGFRLLLSLAHPNNSSGF